MAVKATTRDGSVRPRRLEGVAGGFDRRRADLEELAATAAATGSASVEAAALAAAGAAQTAADR